MISRWSRRTSLLLSVLASGLVLVSTSACNLLPGAAVPAQPGPAASPTLLPPPKPFTSPEPGAGAGPPAVSSSPSPAAAAALATPIPPPNVSAAPPASSGERVRVVNTEGQGANMRAEPSPTGPLVRTVREGTELEAIGAEREGGGRRWRNVRDPASGTTGWIVVELLEAVTAAPPAAAAPAASPAAEKPSGEPKPVASPAAAGSPSIAAKPAQRIDDADRAYLAVLQAQVDALGKGINASNEQIERAGGRPEMLNDPAWQRDTRAAADSLSDAAAKIRAATPGPNTGEASRYANNTADRADEAADGLRSAIDTKDARALNGVRTSLVRLIGELNNMTMSLLNLQ